MTAPIVPPAGRDPASPGQREAARDYLTRLRQQGGTYRSIAAVAVLSPDTVYALASGSRRAQPGTATAVLTVTSPALPHARLDATGTRLRLRALHVMGHGSARIARAAGVHPVTIRKLVRGDARTVSAQLRDAIAGLYDAWWDKRAPGRTRFERAAATAARNRAMAGDWCAAAALDDDWLDIPGYQPEYGWKPATGTGTAPDIHPSALPQEKERHMADDQRLTWGFILEVLDVLERHGYRRSDSEHTGQAIGLIRHVARIYEGTLDAPRRRLRRGAVLPADGTAAARPARPGRRHRLGRGGQDPAGRAGRRRRIQAGPGRDVRRLRRPVLHHLPVAPAGRRCLRPDGRPHDPRRRGLRRPAARPRPRGASQRRPARGRRQGGRTVTRHRTALAPCRTGRTRQVTA